MHLIDQVSKALNSGMTVKIRFISGETQEFEKDYAKFKHINDSLVKVDYEDGIFDIINLDTVEKITMSN